MESKINTFRHLVASLKQDKEDITYLIEDELGMLCLKAKEMLKIFEEKVVLRIKQCLQDFFEKSPDTSPTVLRNEMQKIIEQEIIKGFDVFRKDTERVISKNTQETVNHFLGRSNNIIHEFKTAVEIIFEVPMNQFEYSIDILRDSSFYCIAQERTVVSGNEFKFILRAFLSQSISRKLVLYEMIAGMTSDVSRNCDRMLCDLTSGKGRERQGGFHEKDRSNNYARKVSYCQGRLDGFGLSREDRYRSEGPHYRQGCRYGEDS